MVVLCQTCNVLCQGEPSNVALTIDTVSFNAVSFDASSGRETEHKCPPDVDDSDLTLAVVNILNYYASIIPGKLNWLVFAGDMTAPQKTQLSKAVEEFNFAEVIYVSKNEGHWTFLFTRMFSTSAPMEDVGIIIDRGTSAEGYFWKHLDERNMARSAEVTVKGTGIEGLLTIGDVQKLKEQLLRTSKVDKWIIEYSENQLILETFFDYRMQETFLRIGLGCRTIFMVQAAPDTFFKGAIMRARKAANDYSALNFVIAAREKDGDDGDENLGSMLLKRDDTAVCSIM